MKLSKEQKDELRKWLDQNPDQRQQVEKKQKTEKQRKRDNERRKSRAKKQAKSIVMSVLGELAKEQRNVSFVQGAQHRPTPTHRLLPSLSLNC